MNMQSSSYNVAPSFARWPQYDESAIEGCAELLRRGVSFDYGYSEHVEALEVAFAKAYNRKYCLAVNSGTSALWSMYFGASLPQGSEVIVPVFTFPTTVTPLLHLGLKPVFADVGDEVGNLSIDTIENKITERTSAVAVTHMWGYSCSMEPIIELCRKRKLRLFEDCSHAHGAHRDGQVVGTNSTASVFSIGGLKTVSGGMGGILLTDCQELFEKAVLFGHFQKRSRISVKEDNLLRFSDTGLGGNMRISPLAALLASSHLSRLADIIDIKRQNVKILTDFLVSSGAFEKMEIRSAAEIDPGGNYSACVKLRSDLVGKRDQFIRFVREAGGLISVPNTFPLHTAALFADVRTEQSAEANDFPGAMRLHDQLVGLPDPYLYGSNSDLLEWYLTIFESAIRHIFN